MDDLISEFITETSESLSVLDLELVKLEQNPNDEEILGNIFRLVHTIKGTCGFLGLPRLESVAHAGENVLGKIRDNEIEVTPEAISIVLDSLDRIKGMIDYLAEHGEEPEGEDKELIDALNAFAEGKGEETEEVPVAPEAGMEEVALEGGLTQEELDALEAAFNAAEATVDGGAAAESPQSAAEELAEEAPAESVVPEPADAEEELPEPPKEEAAVPEPAEPAPKERPKVNISDKAKKTAVKKGLQADPKEVATSGLANQSIRVNLDVLENLMQMVGELVLTRNQLLQIARNRDDSEFKAPLQHLSHITTELQEGVMKTRMQPIGNAWAKFPRLIRDLSIELGKRIELRMVGAETELDRQLLELIRDPLTHMVRNSCDHGLEGPEDRLGAGKSETGTVTLKAYHEGGHIIIEISDDGRGVNIERVSQKIIESGLASESELADMTDQQIMQYIFKPGFSTAEQVTSVSGRGVGMDVVRTNIEKIGGAVELSSQPGKGSVFHIKIPLTLAIVSVLIVESGGQCFAVPQINVLELVRSAADSEYQIENISNAPVLRLRDKLLPLVTLADALCLERSEGSNGALGGAEGSVVPDGESAEPNEEPKGVALDGGLMMDEQYIVVCKIGDTHFGIIVDRIFDTEEIVVKPVCELMKNIDLYSGNTILGDGSVIMILDPNGLARLIGEGEGSVRAEEEDVEQTSDHRKVSFLLFKSGDGAPKAVPLELVSRLEEINAKDIELSGSAPVIQYRDDLMRLTTLHGDSMPEEGLCEVVVFTYDNKTIGLVVDEILDIVEAPLQVKMASADEAYLGSMVIASKTTDVVDVGYLLRDMIGSSLSADLEFTPPEDCHVMLVEDSMFFRKLTVPFLKNAGYNVLDYGLPSEALEALNNSRNRFDVVVTDIEMPEMDGFGLAERVRENSDFDHVPIIAFTSTINPQFITRGEEVGMNKFILKTDRESLVLAIAEQLSPIDDEEEVA